MKLWIVLLIVTVAGAAGWLLRSITFNKSPITEAAHREFDQHMRKIISSAESMPANRYGYAPVDSDKYFLAITEQVGTDVVDRCAQLVNLEAGRVWAVPKLKGRFPEAVPEEFKNEAVNHLKGSTDLCDKTFSLLNDSQLKELVTVQGDQKVTKAELLMDMLGGIARAENEMDLYLKLNGTGSAPPSSK